MFEGELSLYTVDAQPAEDPALLAQRLQVRSALSASAPQVLCASSIADALSARLHAHTYTALCPPAATCVLCRRYS